MASSFVVSLALLIVRKQHLADLSAHHALLITIGVTTICWTLTAFFGPQTDRKTLVAFYKKVRPFGPGWGSIRQEAGITNGAGEARCENIPLALVGWSASCALIWASLFTIGNFLYGRNSLAELLMVAVVVSGSVLLWIINRLWGKESNFA